jgi:hypothetical protein
LLFFSLFPFALVGFLLVGSSTSLKNSAHRSPELLREKALYGREIIKEIRTSNCFL